jgi:hypothetical protein
MSVIEQLKAGQAVFEWAPLVSEYNGYKLVMAVPRDSIKFPVTMTKPGGTEPESRLVRSMVTAKETQEAADFLFSMMLTPKLEDLIFQQATVLLAPITRIDGDICAVSTDVRHSELIDKALEGKDNGGLISTVGKSWVLSNFLADPKQLRYGTNTACNYGWVNKTDGHLAVTPGLRAWQPPSYQHNDVHKDPSQNLRVVFGAANLTYPDGTIDVVRMRDVLTDAKLAPLVSHEGPLRYLRQVNVPAPKDPFGDVLMGDEGLVMLPVGLYNPPDFIGASPQSV